MSTLVFESGKGNNLTVALPDVINKVSAIAVKDSSDTVIKYGTKINAGKEYTYYVTQFANDPSEADLNGVSWTFWLNKTQDELSEKSFPVAVTAEKEDQEKDYLMTSSDKAENYNAIKNNGIISAKLETIEETVNGKKQQTPALKVKFSKWLDGELIKVEAALEEKFSLDSKNNNVASRELCVETPEIAEIYWKTRDGERIEKTGYSEEITMHVVSLGLKGKTLEVQTYEQDHDTQEKMHEGDQIDWKNNQFAIEGRNFERQFKVASKESHKGAREEDVANDSSPFTSFFDFAQRASREESTEDLELSIHVVNASALGLDQSKTYGSLILTPKEAIVDAYFAKVDQASMAMDAPMSKGANTKGKTEKHEKLDNAIVGQKLTIVAECDNINDQEVVFKIFESDKLLAEADTALKVDKNGTEVDEIVAKVEDGYATAEIKLRPKADSDFKKWLTTMKVDGKPSDRKKGCLYIQVHVKDSPVVQKFYKDSGFEVSSTNWHEPVDDPQLCLYTQNGNYRPRYNVFGNVRIERTNKPKHQGIDLLALPGSNVYACLDGEVVRASNVGSGYGNVVTIKVKNPQEMLNRKREFTLVYSADGEISSGTGFNETGDFYIFYAHLQSSSVSVGQKVTAGQLIGANGTSGYGSSKDPHLHYEILNKARAGGLNNRCHPGYYCYYKGVSDMTQEEKDYHEKIAEQYWD